MIGEIRKMQISYPLDYRYITTYVTASVPRKDGLIDFDDKKDAPGQCRGEQCLCGRQAFHKIAEEQIDGQCIGHGHTQYLCRHCFNLIFNIKQEK